MPWGPPAFMSPTSSPMTATSLDRRAVVINWVPSVCAYSRPHQMAGHHGPWNLHPQKPFGAVMLVSGALHLKLQTGDPCSPFDLDTKFHCNLELERLSSKCAR